jgi:thiamine-monophosphate kinase
MSLGEFDLIDRLLKPLARGFPGALDLTDDAAVIDVPAGRQLVVAKDAIVADVHFLADDPPELVAGKLLRVNLSDLAAMGAEPLAYLTAIARPPAIDDT